MSERKTFTIGNMQWEREMGEWSVRPQAQCGGQYVRHGGALADLADAHCAALDEIERLHLELRDKANMLTSMIMSNGIPARLIRTDAEAAMATSGQCLAAEIERLKESLLKAEIEREFAVTRAEDAQAEIERLKAEVRRLEDSLDRSDDGYTCQFVGGNGLINDSTVAVYYHGKHIGDAPPGTNFRALIERHKAEMASAAQRQTPESRQGMAAPAKPAGLSEEET